MITAPEPLRPKQIRPPITWSAGTATTAAAKPDEIFRRYRGRRGHIALARAWAHQVAGDRLGRWRRAAAIGSHGQVGTGAHCFSLSMALIGVHAAVQIGLQLGLDAAVDGGVDIAGAITVTP